MNARIVRLGEVAEFVRGVTYKPVDVTTADDPHGIPCLRTKNIQELLDDDDLVYIPRHRIKPSKIIREGDILVSSANSWNLVGKCSWISSLGYDATFGGFTSVLRGDESVVFRRYLYHWFSSPKVQQLARSFGKQTTNISNLNQERCLDLEIPLPPLDEQKRIAAILDKGDALRAKRRQAVALLDSLTQSIFLEMFGDLTSGTKKWPSLPLREIAEVGSGITKGRKLNSTEAIEVPYLAVANVQDKALNLTTVKTIEATPSEIGRYRLETNDLLLTEGGDPDKLGRGTLWRGELPLAIHQNHIFRVRFVSSRIEPLFANWLIGSAYGKNFFLKSAKQTTGIASINKSQLSDFPMIVPPLDLQRSFVKRAETISTQMGAQVAHMGSLGRAFAVLQSLAFRGEI